MSDEPSDSVLPPSSDPDAGVPSYCSRYSKGYRPDDHDTSKDPTARSHFGARPSTLPASVSLESYAGTPWDQLRTEACVGFALAMALYIRGRMLREKSGGDMASTPKPSPASIYTPARALERADANQPLLDFGSKPFLAVMAISQLGVASLEAWPFDEATINDEPTLGEVEAAMAYLVTGYYRVNTQTSDLVEDVCHALSEGYPVVVGARVGEPFEDYNGEGVVTHDPAALDGHMLCVIGYRTTADGKRQFLVINSWGRFWGDYGLCWADEAFLQGTIDRYVVTASLAA